MGYYFDVHHDLRLVYKKVWGRYDDKQSAESHAEWDLVNKEGDIGNYDELQDLTEVTQYSVSLEAIRQLANRYEREWNAEVRSPKRLAYVAPAPVAFGTGRVYGSLIGLSTGINFKVFKSIPDAAKWLELAPDDLARVIAKKAELPARAIKAAGR